MITLDSFSSQASANPGRRVNLFSLLPLLIGAIVYQHVCPSHDRNSGSVFISSLNESLQQPPPTAAVNLSCAGQTEGPQMKTQDENRAAWAKHVEYLRTLPCENVDPASLDEVERAIRRFPYPSISDAVMQINGGWIAGPAYDLCLAWLLQNGCLEPSGFGLFRVNRRKLPLIEVENPIADAIDRVMHNRPDEVSQASLFGEGC